MEFINIKNDEFTYCGKAYIQKRMVSTDRKILITFDNLDLVRVYVADEAGRGKRIYLAEKESIGYPIYSIDTAIKLIEQNKIDSNYTLVIHETQYTKFKNKAA